MIMNSPNDTAARVNHLRVSGAKIRARIILLSSRLC
jgi:hypothetical protein